MSTLREDSDLPLHGAILCGYLLRQQSWCTFSHPVSQIQGPVNQQAKRSALDLCTLLLSSQRYKRGIKAAVLRRKAGSFPNYPWLPSSNASLLLEIPIEHSSVLVRLSRVGGHLWSSKDSFHGLDSSRRGARGSVIRTSWRSSSSNWVVGDARKEGRGDCVNYCR